MSTEKPQAVLREDYCPPDYWIDRVDLSFDLGEEETQVRTRLQVRRREDLSGDLPPLILVGEELECLGVWLDGESLPASRLPPVFNSKLWCVFGLRRIPRSRVSTGLAETSAPSAKPWAFVASPTSSTDPT